MMVVSSFPVNFLKFWTVVFVKVDEIMIQIPSEFAKKLNLLKNPMNSNNNFTKSERFWEFLESAGIKFYQVKAESSVRLQPKEAECWN